MSRTLQAVVARSILRAIVWHSISTYEAVVQINENGEAYRIELRAGGKPESIDISDAATFAAVMAVLSSGKAEYDVSAGQFRVRG
jgi:hypothetical protein